MGNMIKEWVVFNNLEDFNLLFKYTDDDFTPTGNLCYTNEMVNVANYNFARTLQPQMVYSASH